MSATFIRRTAAARWRCDTCKAVFTVESDAKAHAHHGGVIVDVR